MVYAIMFGIPILLIFLGLGSEGSAGCLLAGVGIFLLLGIVILALLAISHKGF